MVGISSLALIQGVGLLPLTLHGCPLQVQLPILYRGHITDLFAAVMLRKMVITKFAIVNGISQFGCKKSAIGKF